MFGELWRSDGEANEQAHTNVETKGKDKTLPSSEGGDCALPQLRIIYFLLGNPSLEGGQVENPNGIPPLTN